MSVRDWKTAVTVLTLHSIDVNGLTPEGGFLNISGLREQIGAEADERFEKRPLRTRNYSAERKHPALDREILIQAAQAVLGEETNDYDLE